MPHIRIDVLSRLHGVDEAAVVDLWTREAGLTPERAERRLPQVLLAAATPDGELAGVSTAYLKHHEQLRMDLWHFRVFVAEAHRGGDVAASLAKGARDLLRDRFRDGTDVRGAGMVFEVENAGLKGRLHAVWPTTGFVFVGEGDRGRHVRVQFFDGARAPLPAGVVAVRIARLSEPPGDWRTETLRGRLDDAWSERLVRFWTENGALAEDEARRRLPEVVSVLLDAGGALAGVSSAFAAEVPLIGGRCFWIFRSFVLPAAAEGRDGLVAATFAALEAEFDPAGDGPIGLCLLLSPAEAAQRPEAVWSDPTLLYAGYSADGRQVRIGYFAGASVGRG